MPCDPVSYSKNKVLEAGQCFVKSRSDRNEMKAKLQATKEWIGVPDLTMVYNNMRLDMS